MSKSIVVEVNLIGEGTLGYAPQTVATLLKNRVLEIFNIHPDYKQFIDTDITVSIRDKEVVE